MEIENAIFQELEGKQKIFKMAMEKSWSLVWKNFEISYTRRRLVSY